MAPAPSIFFHAALLAVTATATPHTTFDVSRTISPVTNVTVFVDRAEVTRALPRSALTALLSAKADDTMQHDIVLRGLPIALDPDSIRVRILDPRVKLLELSQETRWTKAAAIDEDDDRSSATKRAELESRIEVLVNKITLDKQALQRLHMQLSFVEGYARSVTGTAAPLGSALSTPSSRDRPAVSMDVETVQQVIDLYTVRAASVDSDKNAVNKRLRHRERELAGLRAQVGALDHQKKLHGQPVNNDRRTVYDVTLSVEVVADAASVDDGDATAPAVLLVYMVHGASWSPSYDIRVSDDSDGLSLAYFGRIQQSTGEDWDQCAVKLSTATPSVGGRPPSLGSKTVRYRAPHAQHYRRNNVGGRTPRSRHRRMAKEMHQIQPASASMESTRMHPPPEAQRLFARGAPAFANAAESFDVEVEADGTFFAEESRGGSTATASVEAGATSAAFVIERSTTITGDNKQRKVTIALISMQTVATYYSVPALEPKAYYRARATNPSEYPLLASQSCSVFFGSEFIGRTSLDATNPGESFTMFLGVDAAVKIGAKPVKKTTVTTGITGKYLKSVYHHRVNIKNTKRVAIQITLALNLPRSDLDEITVKMTSPKDADISSVTKADLAADVYAPLFTGKQRRVVVHTGNVVWSLKIPPGETTDIVLEYEIERPVGKEVEIV